MIGWLKRGRNKTAKDGDAPIVMEGARKSGGGRTKNRIVMTMSVFFAIYAVMAGRLVYYGTHQPEDNGPPAGRPTAARPDIVDRNGEVLATDIKTASLYAEPRRIVDIDEAIDKLATVLPDIDYEQVYNRLNSKAGFVWLRRQLTPKQEADILQLGIPGIGFRSEKRRFYPAGSTVAHVVGLVNVDNKGIAGMEKWVDDQGLAVLQQTGLATANDLKPVKLSIDLRIQHVIHDEITQAMERYRSIAAGAVVLNAKTGEILGMASVPDFDPNNPYNANEKDRLNRMSGGVYEMGSTFKTFTTAMALDSGRVKITDKFDASHPLHYGRYTIHDYHAKGRVLSVPEIFIYSSNIGTAKEAEKISIPEHKAFLTKLGLLTKMPLELPEVATPLSPDKWTPLNQITIAFGHGVATTPLQTAVAGSAVMNGGFYIPPTLLPRTEAQAEAVEHRVLRAQTSAEMRYLMRLNVEKGSGRQAAVPGFLVGGKTGTADKVVNGRYAHNKNFDAFLAAFPIDDPQYVVLVILDEPKPYGGWPATAGANCAPTAGAIIRRIAPMLGVEPEFGHDTQALLVSYH
ncbi:MAG: penicillin-binding protein 2 [Hyphomicrobiales bacterium]|nr:penicillin-binding protein 2 [Hyphomicrobiales bacterium]